MTQSQGSGSKLNNRAKQAQDYCQRALQHYQKGNLSGAIKALSTALDLDRSLRSDERFQRFAARIVGLPSEQAIDALIDLKRREALILQAGKRVPTKSAPLQAQPLWILGSVVLFLTIMGVMVLVLSGQLTLNPLDPLASQGEVELHHLATDSEQTYLVAAPIGHVSDNGWPVLVAVHGKGQTGQDMVNMLGDVTRSNGILLIAPTFTSIQQGKANDNFYVTGSNRLASIIEEVKTNGMTNPKHYLHYLGQVFFGYSEGGSLITYVANQGLDYPDAGYTREGPMGVILGNPRAPLFDAASYYLPPVYLLLYGELAPQAGVSRDYHRRLKNQNADVYMEASAGADASMTANQINMVASFVVAAYNLVPSFVVTATP